MAGLDGLVGVYDAAQREFFDRVARGELWATRSDDAWVWPVASRDPRTLSPTRWERLSGRATLETWTTNGAALRFGAPTVIGTVLLDELAPVRGRLLTVVDVPGADLAQGLPLRFATLEAAPGLVVHRFVSA